MTMNYPTPPWLEGIEHADGVIHAVDPMDLESGQNIWRVTPVCGIATGVSSDEGGRFAIGRPEITCRDCIGIISEATRDDE